MDLFQEKDSLKNTNTSTWENYCKIAEKGDHLIDLIEQAIIKKETFYSFELISDKDFHNYQRFFNGTRKYFPLFQSVTWHSRENVNKMDLKNILPLKFAEKLPGNTLLHLPGKGLTSKTVERILNHALECGIKNICALQGDSVLEMEETGDFEHASDLVKFIRKNFASKFCICVAGYPEMHPKSETKEKDLFYLKTKVDAGADFIITQIFFEAKIFIDFAKDCRKMNITVPIIPGIFPFSNYKSLIKISNISHVEISKFLLDALEPIKEENEKVEQFGIQFTKKIVDEILQSGTSNGFHLFAMNRFSTVSDILEPFE